MGLTSTPIVSAGDSETTPALADTPEGRLVQWVMGKVTPWRNFRDNAHKDKWDEYYRLWRGRWAESDKTRASERSKIVTPATMQAVDSTVAEIEEAIFGLAQWFDLDQDVRQKVDQDKLQEILATRDRLLEKAEENGVPVAVCQSILMGAIWGNGIGKINTEVRKVKRRTDDGQEVQDEKVIVELIPIEPYEFVPDPTTADLDEMLGYAHETVLPMHKIKRMIKDGAYFDTPVSAYSGTAFAKFAQKEEAKSTPPTGDGCMITEWHGKVPAKYLLPLIDSKMPPEVRATLDESDEDDNLLESIVTIANESTLLGAKKNPFWLEDRCVVSYQHDTVPGYFWGRGVPEKGYNPQKGLDATVRARTDHLGIVANPMMAGDVTRLPGNKGMNLSVYPGKFWPVSGNPNEVLSAIQFGNFHPELFNQAQDMERMVQTATGAMDPSASYSPNQGSATNTAINSSAFIKRSRRTMQNIERNFLGKLIKKFVWRHMQFAPDVAAKDYDFVVKGTLGIMAREFEKQQDIQLLSIVPQESPPFMAILKGIVEKSNATNKAEMVAAIDALLHPPKDPKAEQEAEMQKQLAMAGQKAAVDELTAKADKARADAGKARADAIRSSAEARVAVQGLDLEEQKLHNEAIDQAIKLREVQAFENQNIVSSITGVLKAQATAAAALGKGISPETVRKGGELLASAAMDQGPNEIPTQ